VSPDGAPLGVLFDLDGTLLDTAPDMVGAVNALRVEEGLPAMPFVQLRPHVSHGAARLIEVGFGCSDGDRFQSLRGRFLDLYRGSLSGGTRLFDGLDTVLCWLEARRIPWGVVTNKPAWLTDPLLAELELAPRAACVISGDSLAQKKPHPLPLLHAAALMRLAPGRCAYVGDAERDIQAGRAAGMRTCVAAFGYLGEDDDPSAWRPDAIADRPEQLLWALGFPGDPV
jgi:2-phosphoglycolate phosphatase